MQQQPQDAGRQTGEKKQKNAPHAGKAHIGLGLQQPPEALPVQDNHGHDGAKLDDHIKGIGLFAHKSQQVAGKDEMTGGGHGQIFRETFHNAQNEGDKEIVHAFLVRVPAARCQRGMPRLG